MLTGVVLTVFAAGAALQDLWKDKIYNVYVLGGLLCGIAASLLTDGFGILPARGLCVALAFGILIPVYLIGGLGAGDVKFLTGIAAFLPCREWLLVTGGAFVLTAAYGVCRLAVRRSLHGTVHFAVPVFVSVLILQGVNYL